jgi:hypothetical protein
MFLQFPRLLNFITMKAAEFTNKIRALKPGSGFLAGKELPGDFIEELLSSYDILPKEDRRPCRFELEELVQNYDVKGFEVAGITFKGEAERRNGYIAFANVELDELVVDEADGKVKLLSFETGEVLFECAAESEAFLDALYEMLRLTTDRIKYEKFTDPCSDSTRLAHLSGLPGSVEFYRWISGCDEYAAAMRASEVNPREN